MNDSDFDAFRQWDAGQPNPPSKQTTEAAILKVLSSADQPLPEYDVVRGVLDLLRPQEIWYQTIVTMLADLAKEGRVGITKHKDEAGFEAGVWFEECRYVLKNPLDRIAGI